LGFDFVELSLLFRSQLAAFLFPRGLFREIGAQQRDGMTKFLSIFDDLPVFRVGQLAAFKFLAIS
jgi:hypothetical protein